VQPPEGLEERVGVVHVEARAVVADEPAGRPLCPLCPLAAQLHHSVLTAGGELPGVPQQVLQQDPRQLRVRARRQPPREPQRDAPGRGRRRQRAAHLARERGQVEGLAAKLGAAQAREAQDGVDQPPHALRVGVDALEVVAGGGIGDGVRAPEQLAGEPAQRPQRLAQVVGDGVGERVQLLVGQLQPLGLRSRERLGPLDGGDVVVRPQHAHGPALCVADGHPPAAHPHRRAVRVAVADHLIVGMGGVRAVGVEVLQRALEILGVDEVLPLAGEVLPGGRVEAQHLPEAGAHPLALGLLQVPVPDAVEGAGLEELEDRRLLADERVELALQVVPPGVDRGRARALDPQRLLQPHDLRPRGLQRGDVLPSHVVHAPSSRPLHLIVSLPSSLNKLSRISARGGFDSAPGAVLSSARLSRRSP